MRVQSSFRVPIRLRYVAFAALCCGMLVYGVLGNWVPEPFVEDAIVAQVENAGGAEPVVEVISQRADTEAVFGVEPLPGRLMPRPVPPVVSVVTTDASHATAGARMRVRDCVDDLQEMGQMFTLWFESGETRISSEGREMLRIVGAAAKACPEAHVVLGGHADGQGEAFADLKISWARADAALDVLRALKLDVANIEPRGFGAELPYAQGDASEDAENRRVEFQVIRIEEGAD